jgi:membrane-bound ClpP family serine protease
MDDQAVVAPSSDKPWLFAKGNTEYRARKDRIAERVAQLATEYEADSAVSKQLLEIAAVHLDTAARTHSNVLRGRSTRLAMKVLDRLERKPQPPKLNAFDQYVLDSRGGAR